MTRFDEWHARNAKRLIDDDDRHGVIFVNALKHLEKFVVPSSTLDICLICGQKAWVSPSSRETEGRLDSTRYICCCCIEVHTPEEFDKFMTTLPIHAHKFGPLGVCECGTTLATYDGELGRFE